MFFYSLLYVSTNLLQKGCPQLLQKTEWKLHKKPFQKLISKPFKLFIEHASSEHKTFFIQNSLKFHSNVLLDGVRYQDN